MTPEDPSVAPAGESPKPPPVPVAVAPAAPAAVARPGLSITQILAIAAAISGGGLLTLLVMSSRPAAREETPAAPVTAPNFVGEVASKPNPSTPGAAMPTWSTRNQSRWISNPRRSAAFELESNAPVSVWMKQVRPTLVVRCVDKRTDVFVYTDSAARIEEQDENHTVRIAFDGDDGDHERWPDSLEHDALFAPDGKAMAARIKAAHQMRFTFSPHNAAPVTATFEVAGLEQLLAPVAKACGSR